MNRLVTMGLIYQTQRISARGYSPPCPAASGSAELAVAAGPALSCALQESHSMHFADVALLPFLLRAANSSTGRFVEIGALDGVRLSNTLMLERCFGWTGLLIEGSPVNFAELRRNRRRGTGHTATRPAEGAGWSLFRPQPPRTAHARRPGAAAAVESSPGPRPAG